MAFSKDNAIVLDSCTARVFAADQFRPAKPADHGLRIGATGSVHRMRTFLRVIEEAWWVAIVTSNQRDTRDR
jgi:hypothetical protein